MRKTRLAAVAAGVVLAGGLGVALGFAAGGDSNQINACVNGDGVLRVVTVTGSDGCKKHETPLHWSITGPQGSQGIQGVTGPQGLQGPQGP